MLSAILRRVMVIGVTGCFCISVVSWIISYWNPALLWIEPAEGVTAVLQGGVLMIDKTRYVGGPRTRRHQLVWGGFTGLETQWVPPWFMRSGILGKRGFTLYCPVNLVAVVLGPVVAYVFLPVHRRRRRLRLGLCPQCGYEVRQLTGPRCPECGTPLDPRGPAATQGLT